MLTLVAEVAKETSTALSLKAHWPKKLRALIQPNKRISAEITKRFKYFPDIAVNSDEIIRTYVTLYTCKIQRLKEMAPGQGTGASLLMRFSRKGIGGSNPLVSAWLNFKSR